MDQHTMQDEHDLYCRCGDCRDQQELTRERLRMQDIAELGYIRIEHMSDRDLARYMASLDDDVRRRALTEND